MSREQLERITCDRCGHPGELPAATLDRENERERWARIHVETHRGRAIIEAGAGDGPADLCAGCTEQLNDWYDAGRREWADRRAAEAAEA